MLVAWQEHGAPNPETTPRARQPLRNDPRQHGWGMERNPTEHPVLLRIPALVARAPLAVGSTPNQVQYFARKMWSESIFELASSAIEM